MNLKPSTFLVSSVALASIAGLLHYFVGYYPYAWQIPLGVSAGLFAFYIFKNWSNLRSSLRGRNAQAGMNSAIMVVIGVGIAVFINLIVNQYDVKKDLTKGGLHSLSEQSVKVVKGLTGDVTFRTFVYPGQRSEYDKVFEKYTYHSPKIHVAYVDIDKDPTAVMQYNIKEAGTILVETAQRTARIENLRDPNDPKVEQKITNAIIQVEKGDKRKVYFLTGHRERRLDNTQGDGLSELKERLEESRYEVQELSLSDKKAMPEDTELVICAAPASDFYPHEIDAIDSYIKKGGKFLLMLEPDSTPMAKTLLAKLGLDWTPRKAVVELNQLAQLRGGNPVVPVISDYDRGHEITRDANEISMFPIATPLEKKEPTDAKLKVTGLLKTSASSMRVPMEGNKVTVKSEKQGPLTLAFAVSGTVESGTRKEEKKPETDPSAEKTPDKDFRVVVVGDSDFVSNGGMRLGANPDLFQNMLAWLVKEEDLIAIRPTPTDSSKFDITANRMKIINLASVVVGPLLMLFSGLGVWLSRRRR